MRIFEKISKNIEISNFTEERDKKYMEWRGTLRVLRAGTWLTVYRTIVNTETVTKPGRLGPAQKGKLMDFFRVNHALLDDRQENA